MPPHSSRVDPANLGTLFDSEWAEAWCAEIAAGGGWRRTAAGWCGILVFEATALPGPEGASRRAVMLDLDGDGCRGARSATPSDLAAADYRLEAEASQWLLLLAGELDPVWAMLAGKLKVVTGTNGGAMPGQQAAREIIAAARRVAQRRLDSPEV